MELYRYKPVRKYMRTIFLLIILTRALTAASVGIPRVPILYVSIEGNDAWEGTADQPLASLQDARDMIWH